MTKTYLAVDIGATNVKYCLIDDCWKISYFNHFQSENKDGFSILNQIKDIIGEFIDCINGVAISSAGIIEANVGIIKKSGAFPSLNELNICDWFNNIYPSLPVSIENDGNCAVFAEKALGYGKDIDSFVSISIGSAVGGGIFLNNDILRGTNLLTGEFGSSFINLSSRQRLNSVTGIKSVRARYANIKQCDISKVSSEEMLSEFMLGNEELDNIILDFYRGLAMFICNLNYIINTDRIIISGGITTNKDFKQNLLTQLDELNYGVGSNIYISKLGERTNLYGALYFHLKKFSLI